jgi:hypothetical protein
VEPVRQDIPEIGDPIAALFVAGSDEWTTRIVQGILVAHPACMGVPALSFLFAPGGLADLLAGRTTMERCLEVLRGDWYAASPDIQELCPPDRSRRSSSAFNESGAAITASWRAAWCWACLANDSQLLRTCTG